MAKEMIFFLDFDGTITKDDVCETMISRYAQPGWENLNRLWETGVLSTIDCAQKTLDTMIMTEKNVRDLADEQEVDPQFFSFLAWTREREYPVYILSDGYENYIDLILATHDLHIPSYANRLRYAKGKWKIEAPYYNQICGRCGVCKSKLILDLMGIKSKKIYIGDGYSDRCPVYLADIVFAKKSLLEHCQENQIPFHSYRDFGDVLAFFQNKEEL